MKYIILIFILTISIFASKWELHYPYEIDSIATSWIIKRYIDKNATFVGYEKNVTLNKRFSINDKNSRFRRNGRFTAYEMAKRYYKISDKCTNRLVKIIKVLELMPWKKNEFEDVIEFENGLIPLLPKKSGDINLTKAFLYIDNYCKDKK